jgi:hypothetical protein
MIARVAESEHDLLLVARALVGQVPRAAIEPVLFGTRGTYYSLRPTATRLLKQTLAVGCVRELMRRGGWQRGAVVDDERVVHGRAWERTPPLPLHFSVLSVHLCRWIACEPLDAKTVKALPALAPTLADEILLYLAYELLGPTLTPVLARQEAFRRSALCQLAFPVETAQSEPPPFEPWLRSGGAVVVAALAPDLGRQWIALARRLAAYELPTPTGQDAVADAFLGAIDALGRRDLAQFVIDAGAELARGADARALAGRLAPRIPGRVSLAARAAGRHAAGAPLRALVRVGRWHEAHKLIRHFDDGYKAAQYLLRRWEVHAPLFSVAEGALRDLDALDAPIAMGGDPPNPPPRAPTKEASPSNPRPELVTRS